MGSGFGPWKGTVTFPGMLWRKIEPAPAQARNDNDPFLGTPVEQSDLVLQVVGEGWGAYEGITVIDPESGEHVELRTVDRAVIGTMTPDPTDELSAHEEPKSIVVEYGELQRFRWTRDDRIRSARSALDEAEHEVEQARARLRAAEEGTPIAADR